MKVVVVGSGIGGLAAAIRLGAAGHDVVRCVDPGSTPLGVQVREILLGHRVPIGRTSEMLLFMAARAQLVEEVIRPALDRGQTIVSDRYLLANIVYQGYAGGLDVDEVRAVGQIAVGGVVPRCTFLLDADVERTVERMGDDLDRIERRGIEYRRKLRAGFLAEAAIPGSCIRVVDAGQTIDEVAAQICALAAPLIVADST